MGGAISPLKDELDEMYSALVLGVRDYVQKNGFDHVVLGLIGPASTRRWSR